MEIMYQRGLRYSNKAKRFTFQSCSRIDEAFIRYVDPIILFKIEASLKG